LVRARLRRPGDCDERRKIRLISCKLIQGHFRHCARQAASRIYRTTGRRISASPARIMSRGISSPSGEIYTCKCSRRHLGRRPRLIKNPPMIRSPGAAVPKRGARGGEGGRSGPHEGSIESPQLKETPNYQSTKGKGGGGWRRRGRRGLGNIGKRFDLATAAASSVAPPAFIPPRQIYFPAQWRAICIAAGALAFPTLTFP